MEKRLQRERERESMAERVACKQKASELIFRMILKHMSRDSRVHITPFSSSRPLPPDACLTAAAAPCGSFAAFRDLSMLMRLSVILLVNLSSFASIASMVRMSFLWKNFETPLDVNAFNTLPHTGEHGVRVIATDNVSSPWELV